ncbi:TIGR03617 family F420-dependent LLM class oxidoreductase [Saccharothrix variisporea]|uniref:Putative F420-dependent oxidoreductase n=1 Tax=Saccharothrix variisporea TaxID=543527 RepID=A0A495XDL8_9PSEU|nr:TIGR03617 family F420-dependent LLM class oxidoreductase [Saccharothrix variisporea]RKT71215.1 putative F420-dependent oxidoreductase [Saccharothrix variisporea]
MQVDRLEIAYDPRTVEESARRAASEGCRGFWLAETSHDPFLGLARLGGLDLELGTAIAVAFARNPMSTAVQANDLQLLSGGRFNLGLGSQVEPHITKRFGMPWSRPAARMREFVQALRAIWTSWATGERLRFRGEFYTHTLMTPFFDPGPNPFGPPRVWLAGVGELMTEVAGEVADGFLCHNFTTERYFREVTVPALERGRSRSTLPPLEISAPALVAHDDAGVVEVKRQIAFYGSTPAYRKVLDLHGWGELHEELHRMSRRGLWDDMTASIPDDVMHAFAVVGTPDEVDTELARRYGDHATRILTSA